MHNAPGLLADITLVLGVAAVTTVVFQKLRQPVVLGYLLAGALISPHTPIPLFADEGTIQTLSELGVILLMFALGLEFSFPKLFKVASTAGVVAVIQCSLMIWLGYVAGQAFGWTVLESLYAGALIAISSTTIIVKAFEENHVRGRLAELVYGVLIVEDLIAIFLLAVLTPISAGAGLSAMGLAATTGRLLAFLALVAGGGMLIVPRLMRLILRLDRAETTVVASIGLCFTLALLAHAVGYSVALGAFLAGALVAESGAPEAIEHLILPVRDMFAAIFFVAVGMLIDPALIAEHWGAVLAFTLIVVFGKIGGVAVATFLTGQGVRTSIRAGMSLAQIGEFSFIIAGVGLSLGATGSFLYPLAVTVSAATTLLTPWLIRASDPVANWIDARMPKALQTFAALYGSWVEELGQRPPSPTLWQRVRQLGRLLLLDGALLAAIVIATAVWGRGVADRLGRTLDLPDGFGLFLVLASAAALAAPFFIGIGRVTAALARTLAGAILPQSEGGLDLADAPRRALVLTIEIGILLLLGVPLLALTQPFLSSVPGAAVMVAVIGVLTWALWRSVTNLQEHTRAGAQAIVQVLVRQAKGGEGPRHGEHLDLAELSRLLPGMGTPTPLRLRSSSPAVGQTLAQLDLRGRSGATVLAIVRGASGVVVPTGHEVLQPDDLLALAGTREAVEEAKRMLGD